MAIRSIDDAITLMGQYKVTAARLHGGSTAMIPWLEGMQRWADDIGIIPAGIDSVDVAVQDLLNKLEMVDQQYTHVLRELRALKNSARKGE